MCVCLREREYKVVWQHFVMKLTPISSRRAHETFLRLNSDLTPAAFYWYLGGAAFGAAGYTRRNPPTKSHHNGAARTRQQTVAQFLSRHRQWIISSHHFAEGKKFPVTKFTEQFLMAEDRRWRFPLQPLHWFILSGLGLSLSVNFSSNRSCHTEVKTYLSSSEWILPIWSFKGITTNINLLFKKFYINVNKSGNPNPDVSIRAPIYLFSY